MFGLGRLYYQNYHDTNRARNVWQFALVSFMKQEPALQKENRIGFDEITVNLANLERDAGNYADAINWFEAAQKVSPAPEALQRQIDELRTKLAAQTKVPPASPH